MISTTTLTAALALTTLACLPARAQAQATTYTFYGYVACTKGQLGCAQWPEPPHPWVTFRFGNGLPQAECASLQQASRALTGDGFCEPFIK
jgi:hypothetical protein